MRLFILILIILVVVIVAFVCYWRNKPNQLLRQQKQMWKNLKPDIDNIREINEKAKNKGYKLLTKGNARKSLNESSAKFYEYIQFCKENNLEVSPEQNSVKEEIWSTEDLLDPKGALDRELNRATKQYDQAYEAISKNGEQLNSERLESQELLNEIEDFINSISAFPKELSTKVEDIRINQEKFKGTVEFVEEQKNNLEKTVLTAGGGIAAGAGTALIAPSALMWVATTFGTASTGAAIATLSGAAAHNAALAFIGFGALSAGGGGMALGTTILTLLNPVGWGIAGVSAGLGLLAIIKKNKKIIESKKEEIKRLKNCAEYLKEADAKIEFLRTRTESLSQQLSKSFSRLKRLQGKDYLSLSEKQRLLLGSLVNNTNALAALLNETVE